MVLLVYSITETYISSKDPGMVPFNNIHDKLGCQKYGEIKNKDVGILLRKDLTKEQTSDAVLCLILGQYPDIAKENPTGLVGLMRSIVKDKVTTGYSDIPGKVDFGKEVYRIVKNELIDGGYPVSMQDNTTIETQMSFRNAKTAYEMQQQHIKETVEYGGVITAVVLLVIAYKLKDELIELKDKAVKYKDRVKPFSILSNFKNRITKLK